jgi:hypothetical protein
VDKNIVAIAQQLAVDLAPDEIGELTTYLEFARLGALAQIERETVTAGSAWPPGPTEEVIVSKLPTPKGKAGKVNEPTPDPTDPANDF